MDKTEYKMKLEEINRLVENEEYVDALEIVESIDWRRVKSVRTLSLVAEIYEANQEYEAAKDILLMALDRTTIGKSILYELVSVCIALEEYDEAVEYYSEFIKIAPNDNTRYILKYKIYKARKSPIKDQIAILEQYKSCEYTEKWSYELAKLYQKADMIDKCVEECDDLILWFSEGKYVIKALELKGKYASLTPSQKQIYENRYNKKILEAKVPETLEVSNQEELQSQDVKEDTSQEPQLSVEEPQPEPKPVYVPTVENTVGLQDKLVKGIRSVFSRYEDETDDEEKYEDDDIFEETVTDELDNENDYDIVKELEPEDIESSDIKPFIVSPVVMEEAKPEEESKTEEEPKLEEEPKPEKEIKIEEFDLEALLAETSNSLASEVAKGSYEKTDQLETEKKQEPVQEISEIEEDLGLTKEFDFGKDIKILRAKEAAKQLKETIAAAKNKEDELAKIKQQEPVEVEAFKLPQDILQEIEAKKNRVLEEIPMMKAPVVDDFVIVPKEERENLEPEEPEEAEDLVIDMELPEEEFIDKVKEEQDGVQISEDLELEDEAWCDSENLEEEEKEEKDREEVIFKNLTINLENVIEQAIAEQKEEPSAEEIVEPKIEIKEEPSVEEIVEPKIEIEVEEEPSAEEIPEPKIEIVEEEEEELPEPEGRRFDDEEKRIFTYFAAIPGIDDQVTKALESIRRSSYSKTSKRGNVVIMGRHASGKTRLSNALIIAACRTLGLEASKVAHIDASDMNANNPENIISKLSGGFLVIERAGYMNDETLEKLSKAMELKTDSLTVILEGDKDNMRRMLGDKNKKEIAQKFEQTITIPVFTNDELVTFAKTYAKELGYKLDDMAVLALYTLIGDNQNDNEPVTIGKVKEMVDEAIKRAGKGARRLSRKFSKKQNDNDARIIIYEKDFHL